MTDDRYEQLLGQLEEKNTRLRRKLRELNSLYLAAQMMTSIQDLDELLNGIVQLAANVLQAKTGSLMLLNEETNELRIAAAKGLDEKTVRRSRMRVGESIAGYVVEYGKPLLVKNVEQDQRFRRVNRERYETKSLISVPLITSGKILGVLNLNNKRSGKPFVAADLKLLTSFAAQAAVAVDNVRLLEQNRRKIQELSVLFEIAGRVSAVDGLGQAVENVFQGISQIVSVDHCYWFLWEEKYSRLSLAFAMIADHPLSQWVEGREIYLSEDLLDSLNKKAKRERLNLNIQKSLGEWQLWKPEICFFDSFPILARGQLHGMFCAGSTTLGRISESELQLISIVISQAASLYEQHAALSNATQMMTMSKVASEIAHDLRHPLTNIKGVLQVLETRLYDIDFCRESLQLIHQEIYRLSDLTKELVRFSNPDRFQVRYRDIHRILDRALNLVQNDLNKGEICLQKHYSPDLPLVYVDENEILEIFLNILQNGIEGMADGGTLTVGTALRDHLKDETGVREYLRIDFTDTGKGISPEHRDRIFERYFTTKQNGTGLGLSIANRIVVAHRGFIEVHSVPGKGSTFSVHLPV
jgi:signal transduction histidine kinase